MGGGKKALDGTLECAPPGGGAKDVKLIPPVPGAVGGAEGKRGAGGSDQLGLFRFRIFPCSCKVYVKDASKADMASGDSVCEKLSGGKGTDPGALYV